MKLYPAGGQAQLKTAIPKVGEDMKMYLASVSRLETDLKAESGGLMKAYLAESGGLIFNDANILQSFYYVDDFTRNIIIPNCKDFLLDSGAFTFIQNAKHVDWDEYVEKYAKFVRENKIEKYFELDIDSIVGLKEVERLRAKLERIVGWQCIPVWHRSRGMDYFIKQCEEYPYIAIGGIAIKEIKQNEYPIFKVLIKEAHKRNTKVHGLGFTQLKKLKMYNFDSVDSSSWVSGNRFGAIYWFNGETLEKINKPKGKRVKSSQTAINNFIQWKKFANYVERTY